MKRLGVTVLHIQSDRGSEYFAQDGDTLTDRDRPLHSFDSVCAMANPPYYTLLHPLNRRRIYRKIGLFEAHLSPAFWVDDVAYSQYIYIVPQMITLDLLHRGRCSLENQLVGTNCAYSVRMFMNLSRTMTLQKSQAFPVAVN